MKNLFGNILLYMVLAFSLFPLSTAASSSKNQSYVIFVKGTVKLEKTNKPLKVGDSISNSDIPNLSFLSKNALVEVFDLEQGRTVIRQDSKTPKNNSELLYIVKSIVTPSKFSMSTRGGEINNIQSLREIFMENPLLLLNEEAIVEINPVAFPMNEETFFYVTYDYKGEQINKRLGFQGNKLKLSFSKIFTIDGKPVMADKRGKLGLVYYNIKSGEQINVGVIEYIVPNYKQVKEQVGLLVQLLRKTGKGEKEIKLTVSSFLVDRYGYVSDYDLNHLIDDN